MHVFVSNKEWHGQSYVDVNLQSDSDVFLEFGFSFREFCRDLDLIMHIFNIGYIHTIYI